MKITTTRGVQLNRGKIVAESEEITVSMRPREVMTNVELTDGEKKSPLIISLDKFLKNRGKNGTNNTTQEQRILPVTSTKPDEENA